MHQGDGEALTWLGRGKTTKLLATVLKKIRLYCIIAKYDSFIQVWGEKKRCTENTYTKHMYTYSVTYLEVWPKTGEDKRGLGLNIKVWNALWKKKILSRKQPKCNKTLTCQQRAYTYLRIYTLKYIKRHA